MKKQKDVLSYINSENFVLDNFLVRTGEDTCEWVSFRRAPGKTPQWQNGTLTGVTSGVRHSGSFDDFADYAYKNLVRTYREIPGEHDFQHIKCSVISLLEDAVTINTQGKK